LAKRVAVVEQVSFSNFSAFQHFKPSTSSQSKMNSTTEIQAIVCIQRAFRAALGARGLITCDHCDTGCISVHSYKGEFLCYTCLDYLIDRDFESWYEQEEVDQDCICEICEDPAGNVSRGNLCYDCEQGWREYQVRHFSME
jgi:hypothetical protein